MHSFPIPRGPATGKWRLLSAMGFISAGVVFDSSAWGDGSSSNPPLPGIHGGVASGVLNFYM